MFFGKERKIKKFVQRVHGQKEPKNKYAYVMNEFKQGKLYSSQGYKVKNPAQAKAIAHHMTYGKTSKHHKGITKQSKQTFFSKLKNVFHRRFTNGKSNK